MRVRVGVRVRVRVRVRVEVRVRVRDSMRHYDKGRRTRLILEPVGAEKMFVSFRTTFVPHKRFFFGSGSGS